MKPCSKCSLIFIASLLTPLFIYWNLDENTAPILPIATSPTELHNKHLRQKCFHTNIFGFPSAIMRGFGKRVAVSINDADDGETLNMMYGKLSAQKVSINSTKVRSSSKRYVRVYDKSWEQIGMSTGSLLQLSWQAKIGDRQVICPLVKNCYFWVSEGHSLGKYFNLSYLDNVLLANGYATTVDLKTFERKCGKDKKQAFVHFLYDGDHSVAHTRRRFRLDAQQYDRLVQKTHRIGWSDCGTEISRFRNDEEARYFREFEKARYYCVNTTMITDWNKLEDDIVKRVKCLTIILWKGISRKGKGRALFTLPDGKISKMVIRDSLVLSDDVLEESTNFQRTAFGNKPYLAIHVRGEKFFTRAQRRESESATLLWQYLHLLHSVVSILRNATGMENTFIATDLRVAASLTFKSDGEFWKESANFIKYLKNDVGGVFYEQQRDLDLGVAALVDVSLVSRAKYLITVGEGSFQAWMIGKYINNRAPDSGSDGIVVSLRENCS